MSGEYVRCHKSSHAYSEKITFLLPYIHRKVMPHSVIEKPILQLFVNSGHFSSFPSFKTAICEHVIASSSLITHSQYFCSNPTFTILPQLSYIYSISVDNLWYFIYEMTVYNSVTLHFSTLTKKFMSYLFQICVINSNICHYIKTHYVKNYNFFFSK